MGRVRIGSGKAFAAHDAIQQRTAIKEKSLSPAQISNLITAARQVNKSEIGTVAGMAVAKGAEGVAAAGKWAYDKASGLWKDSETGDVAKQPPISPTPTPTRTPASAPIAPPVTATPTATPTARREPTTVAPKAVAPTTTASTPPTPAKVPSAMRKAAMARVPQASRPAQVVARPAPSRTAPERTQDLIKEMRTDGLIRRAATPAPDPRTVLAQKKSELNTAAEAHRINKDDPRFQAANLPEIQRLQGEISDLELKIATDEDRPLYEEQTTLNSLRVSGKISPTQDMRLAELNGMLGVTKTAPAPAVEVPAQATSTAQDKVVETKSEAIDPLTTDKFNKAHTIYYDKKSTEAQKDDALDIMVALNPDPVGRSKKKIDDAQWNIAEDAADAAVAKATAPVAKATAPVAKAPVAKAPVATPAPVATAPVAEVAEAVAPAASPPSTPIVFWKGSAEATAAMKEYSKFPSSMAVDHPTVIKHLNDAAPKIDKLSSEQAQVLLKQIEFKSSELNSIETGIKAMLKQKLNQAGGKWRTIAAELERKGTEAKLKLPEFKAAKVKSIGSLDSWDELVAEAGSASDPTVRRAILKRGMQLGGERAPRTFFEGLLGPLTGYKKKERGREAVKELNKLFPKLKAAPSAYEKTMAHYKLMKARREGLGLPSKGETPAGRAKIAAQIAKMDAEVGAIKQKADQSEAETNRIRRHTEVKARLYTAQADKIRKKLMRKARKGGGKKKKHTWVGVRLVRQDIQGAKAELKRLRTNKTTAQNVPDPGPAQSFFVWLKDNPVPGGGVKRKTGETEPAFMRRASLISEKYAGWRKTWTDAKKLHLKKKSDYDKAKTKLAELGERGDPTSGIGSQLGRIKLLRDVELATYNIEAKRGGFAERLPGTIPVED